MEDGALWRSAKRVQWVLAIVAIAAAAIVLLGGILGKSSAWTDAGPEGRGSWTDGVRPWAVRAVLGGAAVVGLLLLGRSRRGGWPWVLAGGAALVLQHAASQAEEYRSRLESGMFTVYEHDRLSFGLRVVPVVGTVGSILVAALVLTTLGMLVVRRPASGDRV